MADVSAPLHFRGPLTGGVSIHTLLAPADREKSALEVFDCRLALAVDDFASVVAKYDVVEMIHSNAYRSRAQFDCGALAVDIHAFKKRNGTMLSVEKDFHGRIGWSTCAGEAHPTPPSTSSTELWSFVCEAASRAIFNVILTPNYNAEHFNHFHVEVTPDAEWMLIK
jgi:hypothetical protein